MTIVPFDDSHIAAMDIQEAQAAAKILVTPEYLAWLCTGDAYTVLVDGKPIVSAGVAPFGDGRGLAWALFAQCSGPHFVRLVRYIRRYLADTPFRRVEATVDTRFTAAVRLAKLVGFEIEGTMRQYGRDGGDHHMMARIP